MLSAPKPRRILLWGETMMCCRRLFLPWPGLCMPLLSKVFTELSMSRVHLFFKQRRTQGQAPKHKRLFYLVLNQVNLHLVGSVILSVRSVLSFEKPGL